MKNYFIRKSRVYVSSDINDVNKKRILILKSIDSLNVVFYDLNFNEYVFNVVFKSNKYSEIVIVTESENIIPLYYCILPQEIKNVYSYNTLCDIQERFDTLYESQTENKIKKGMLIQNIKNN